MAEINKSYLNLATDEHLEALLTALVDVENDIKALKTDAADRWSDDDYISVNSLMFKAFELKRKREKINLNRNNNR